MPNFSHQITHKKNLKHLQYSYIKEKTNPMRKFRQKAKSWDLSVDLEGDKMTVTIMNYAIWLVYKQVFTSADMMKINPKIQLDDVFSCFQSSKTNLLLRYHQPQVPVSIFQGNRLRTGYQIINGNQVTVYVRMKNDEIVRFPFQVNYHKNLTGNQIQSLKALFKKRRIIYDRYHPDVNTLQTSSSADDSFFIKTQELIKDTQKQIINDLTQKTNPIIKINNQIEELSNKSITIGRQVSQMDDNSRQEIIAIEREAYDLFKYNTLIPRVTPISNAAKLFQITNPYRDRFKIDGLRVHFAFKVSQQPFFFFTYPIEPNQTDKVKFRIKSKKNTIFAFGFSAYSKQNGLQLGLYDYMTRGGYNIDDEVELYINRTQKIIIYTVNGTLVHISKNEVLARSEYSYLPVVQFTQIDQIVEFVVDQLWYK